MQKFQYFTTKGVDAILGINMKDLRKKLDKLGDNKESEAFVEQLQSAEEQAKSIGEKYVKRVQEHPLVYFQGYDFSHYDITTTGGYRFWFTPATEPDFSI